MRSKKNLRQLTLGVPLPRGKSAQAIEEPRAAKGIGRWRKPTAWYRIPDEEGPILMATPDGWHEVEVLEYHEQREGRKGWVEGQWVVVLDKVNNTTIEVHDLRALRVPGRTLRSLGGEVWSASDGSERGRAGDGGYSGDEGEDRPWATE